MSNDKKYHRIKISHYGSGWYDDDEYVRDESGHDVELFGIFPKDALTILETQKPIKEKDVGGEEKEYVIDETKLQSNDFIARKLEVFDDIDYKLRVVIELISHKLPIGDDIPSGWQIIQGEYHYDYYSNFIDSKYWLINVMNSQPTDFQEIVKLLNLEIIEHPYGHIWLYEKNPVAVNSKPLNDNWYLNWHESAEYIYGDISFFESRGFTIQHSQESEDLDDLWEDIEDIYDDDLIVGSDIIDHIGWTGNCWDFEALKKINPIQLTTEKRKQILSFIESIIESPKADLGIIQDIIEEHNSGYDPLNDEVYPDQNYNIAEGMYRCDDDWYSVSGNSSDYLELIRIDAPDIMELKRLYIDVLFSITDLLLV